MNQFHSLYLLKKHTLFPDVFISNKDRQKGGNSIKETEGFLNSKTSMKAIKLKQTAATPKVTFDKESGLMEIMGASIPEDADSLYIPLINWLEEYAKEPNQRTIFNFGLKYFNTSSSKLLLDILLLLKTMYEDGNDVLIRWHTESHDEDMKETGYDYEEIIQVPFEYATINSD